MRRAVQPAPPQAMVLAQSKSIQPKPATERPPAPSVYKPAVSSPLQGKMRIETRPAPPVYRPQGPVLRKTAVVNQRSSPMPLPGHPETLRTTPQRTTIQMHKESRPAPPVYRPQLGPVLRKPLSVNRNAPPAALQPKGISAEVFHPYGIQTRTESRPAPPAYRPQQHGAVLRKAAEIKKAGGSPPVRPGPGGPSQGVIQRDVGFEFETGWKVLKEVSGLFSSSWVPLKKGDVIVAGANFRMEADTFSDPGKKEESEIEFVIDPPVKENLFGELRLSDALAGITHLAANLEIHGSDGAPFTKTWSGQKYKVIPEGSKKVSANPQVSAGIRLDTIPKLLADHSATAESEPDLFASGIQPLRQRLGAAQQAVTLIGGDQKLVGFVTMVLHYLLQLSGNENKRYEGALDYVKDGLSVLARTDFSGMYKNCGEQMHKLFPTPGHWSAFIGKASELDLNGQVMEAGIRVPDGKPPDKLHPLGTGKIKYFSITRRQWLEGMPNNLDMLSGRINDDFESMGKLGHKTDLIGNGPLHHAPVFELRKNRRALHYKEWPDFARNMFRYFEALGQSDVDEQVHYSRNSAPLTHVPPRDVRDLLVPIKSTPPPVVYQPPDPLWGPGGLFEL